MRISDWGSDVCSSDLHTAAVQIGSRYGMILFITSEVMFFLAFFWAFFDFALYPRTGVWPPEGVETFDAFDLPLMNTLILLLSGTTVTWAHAALLDGDRKNLLLGLGRSEEHTSELQSLMRIS